MKKYVRLKALTGAMRRDLVKLAWQWIGVTNQSAEVLDISALVIDVDETLYPKHHPYHADGTQGEVREIARILDLPYDETEMRIRHHRQELSANFGRPAAVTETIISLGITREQWNDLRCRAWQPEKWFTQDLEVSSILALLQRKYRIAFGTNSPTTVGWRVLTQLGITEILQNARLFGPDTFGISKPNPDFFVRIAKCLGFLPDQCISIGDRMENDGGPALAAGYAGALIVPGGRDAFIAAASHFLTSGHGVHYES